MASFSKLGTSPVSRECLKIICSGVLSVSAQFFKRTAEKPSRPGAEVDFSSLIALTMSLLVNWMSSRYLWLWGFVLKKNPLASWILFSSLGLLNTEQNCCCSLSAICWSSEINSYLFNCNKVHFISRENSRKIKFREFSSEIKDFITVEYVVLFNEADGIIEIRTQN